MALVIATTMMASNIAPAFASGSDYSVKTQDYLNKLDVKPAKPAEGETAEKLIENPDQPEIYTLRTDYKVHRGEKYKIDYQPYVASVGADATPEEQKKVNKKIDLPDLAGYEKPDGEDSFKDTYDYIKNEAKNGEKTGDEKYGLRYMAKRDFKYQAKSNQIKIKHVFQDLKDLTKYTNSDGSVGDETALFTTQSGNTGSTMEVIPLPESNPYRKGFVPERESITMQVPENAENFILEYRYNRAHYDVTFDTQGGTPLPARTLYYGQVIPEIAYESIPTKAGGEFQGWKPSVDLNTSEGKTYKANEIIKDANGKAIENLAANLTMPPSKVTFTAVWKEKEKADYAVQFWAEKADHADGASIADKYDYIGTHVYKGRDTGSRPDLDKEPVKDIVFPDLDQARLDKIWGGGVPYLNKFYVYNQDLTLKQNADPANVNLVKSVDSTGKTVYNIYYDRQVYDLYFTKSNVAGSAFYPEITKNDKKVGEEGNPYHFKARFNQSMVGLWPDDVKEVRGFDEGNNSLGWLPNLKNPKYFYRDTPPYRLSANLFIDFPELEKQGGYVSEIDLGNGQKKPASITDLSFGIDQNESTMPHHIDFWLDDFDGEQVIDYDLYTVKSDTNNNNYKGFLPPDLQGFTPKKEGGRGSEFKEDSDLDDLNDEREEKTPFPEVYSKELDENDEPKQKGKLYFMKYFPNDEDREFDQNGYLKFEYSRNKYPLRFNYDPSIIRDDSYFNKKNSLDTFYEFPLKALSPDLEGNEEYKKDNPANLLDNPENLEKLGLTDLIFTDPKDGKLKVKRPEGLSDQMAFKGWALDPAGTKLVRDNGSEKMPSHPVNLYAKWGEPDYKWKVTFDPNGGFLRNIKEDNLTKSRKKIQEGDIGQEETKTYPIKEKSVGDKQIFTVFQRQKLVEPNFKPTRKGYDFLGWEVIRYKKNQKGDYTDEIDDSYRETYKVPELYSFGNDVVAPVYLKAIWVPNARVDVKVEHYILDKDYKLKEKLEDTLEDKRADYLVATIGDRQNDKYILAPHEELIEKLPDDLKALYEEYNGRVNANNTYFQQFRVEPEKKFNPKTNQVEANPDVKNNVFKFFYKPFRTREYKVNYVDERAKAELAKATPDKERKAIIEKYSIVDQEVVTNGNRYYDARNYRPIPGWVLAKDEKPQQQLFFDVDDKTNKFSGINGTGSDEITFYYKDVRIIEVPKDAPVPDGYVRVTFKADKGGSFGKDKDGKDIKELYYDVIKGLKSDLLPVPKELAESETVDKDKYYITPETGKKFVKWDNKPLLNKDTIINENHEFTAYFEWSGLSASGLVRTEAFKDPKNKWTNNFAPTIGQLKAQLVWREKDQVKDLPAGTEIKLYDEAGNELTKDDQVYDLVNEKNKADKDELVRKVNIKAKVTFKDGKEPQELDIPITVYKNVYEALNKAGDKPLFLKEAEGKEAKDGGLKDVTGNYVKVTVKASKDFNDKDDKIYYVNKNAWVEIPEVKTDGSSTFVNWTADKDAQNENGIFDFGKRHKFTEDTVISPSDAKDVVEQTDPNKKPDVPDSYVKVIVKTTDKATDETTFKKTFWVNPTKEVTIDVTNPTGKTIAANLGTIGAVGYTMNFSRWETKDKAKTWKDKIVGKFKKETTIVAKYSVTPVVIKPQVPTRETVHTPQGKTPTVEEITKMITPPEGKTIKEVKIVTQPDVNNPGKSKAKVIVEYTDGSSVGTKDKPLEVPVEVHKNIIPEAAGGQKPKEALDNYVKVIFKAGTGGSISGDLVYYVSPEVEVDMTESAKAVTKTPEVGYFVNGEKWTNTANKTLKDTFKDPETVFVFNFDKSKDIVEKTDDPNQVIPKGYVKVSFISKDGNKGKLEGDKLEKIYYVNPKADIKLVELADGQKANDKQLAVPKTKPSVNYVFDRWYEDINTKDSITSERKYEARFKLAELTLTYKAGEGAKGTVPEAVTVDYGTSVRLARPDGLTKENATFAGWKLDGEEKIYQAGDLVKLEKARTATAQWKPAEHSVTFDSNGGSKIDDQKVKHNDKLKAFAEPKQEGKVFMGWKEKGKEDKEDYFDLTSPITEDKNLVAIWQEPVQEIGENDPVEGQFIKVTFSKGEHGELKGKKTYKVAKDLSFEDAVKKGLKVPKIIPSKYYKAKDANSCWDKPLELNKQDITFTAQYELIGDVIPVDKADREDNEIKKEQPEGTVLVEYKVADTDKAYLDGAYKFFVKKGKEVTIRSPLFVKTDKDYDFKGWTSGNPDDQATEEEKNKWEQVAKKDGEEKVYIRGTFVKDEIIINQNEDKPFIEIFKANAGDKYVEINELSEGAEGRLSIVRTDEDGNEVKNEEYESRTKTFKVRRRRKIVTIEKKVFDFKGDSLQSGDIIRFKAVKVKDGEITSESDVTEIVID